MFVEIILEKVTIDDFKVCDIPPLQQGALVQQRAEIPDVSPKSKKKC